MEEWNKAFTSIKFNIIVRLLSILKFAQTTITQRRSNNANKFHDLIKFVLFTFHEKVCSNECRPDWISFAAVTTKVIGHS